LIDCLSGWGVGWLVGLGWASWLVGWFEFIPYRGLINEVVCCVTQQLVRVLARTTELIIKRQSSAMKSCLQKLLEKVTSVMQRASLATVKELQTRVSRNASREL